MSNNELVEWMKKLDKDTMLALLVAITKESSVFRSQLKQIAMEVNSGR